MNILKNKHVVVAMIVAPILAIIAYFAVDHVVSEKPQTALQGGTYKLAAKSNCRYQSGVCTLKNADVEVKIRARRIGAQEVELTMQSVLPVQNAIISFVGEDIPSTPERMNAVNTDMDEWQATLYLNDPEKTILRLALNISDATYYAETTAVFIDFETPFSRENFSK